MEIPRSVYENIQAKYMLSEKNSKRYITEYKKFVLCSICSKIPATPSEQTDYVWHMHLCTNREFPIQMANVIFKNRLGRFDHGPTKGGTKNGEVHGG